MKNLQKSEEAITKSARRESKNRRRMKMHGRSLMKNNNYAGEKLVKHK